jgi:hypothetical protein
MAAEAPRTIAIGMKRKDKSHGHANRTPWRAAAREVRQRGWKTRRSTRPPRTPCSPLGKATEAASRPM